MGLLITTNNTTVLKSPQLSLESKQNASIQSATLNKGLADTELSKADRNRYYVWALLVDILNCFTYLQHSLDVIY